MPQAVAQLSGWMPKGSRIGLLLDLDNGGTLTMYWDNKLCGTIAAGLVGPMSSMKRLNPDKCPGGEQTSSTMDAAKIT